MSHVSLHKELSFARFSRKAQMVSFIFIARFNDLEVSFYGLIAVTLKIIFKFAHVYYQTNHLKSFAC